MYKGHGSEEGELSTATCVSVDSINVDMTDNSLLTSA